MVTESSEIESLLAEMRRHEQRINQIKVRLAEVLLGDVSAPVQRSRPSVARTRPAPMGEHSAVAEGTKGRKVIEAMNSLGGQARATGVAAQLGGPPEEMTKRVRGYYYHLAKEENGYIEKTGKAGLWRLTARAYEVLGTKPNMAAHEPTQEEVTI